MKPNIKSMIMKHRGYRERETVNDIREISHDAEHLQLQAAYIFERVLGPAHPDGLKRYCSITGHLIWKVSEKHAIIEHLQSFKFYPIWYYSLCLSCEFEEPLSTRVQQQLDALAVYTAKVMNNSAIKNQVQFHQVLSVFVKAVDELERGQRRILENLDPIPEEWRLKSSENFVKVVTSVVQLMSLACRIVSEATQEDIITFRSSVTRLVDLNPKGAFDKTVLQLVSSEETMFLTEDPVCAFPCNNCIRLLKEVGAIF